MAQHAAVPKICDVCLKKFLASVEAAPTRELSAVYCWCSHQKAVALCIVRAGVVQTWILEAPVDDEEAARRASADMELASLAALREMH